MSYPRYPQYKDSGIKWLGAVPAHWEVTRLKNTIESAQNGVWGEEPTDDNAILCVRVADFNRRNNTISLRSPTFRAISDSDKKGRLLKCGNLLI